jgi:hypothetical protein
VLLKLLIDQNLIIIISNLILILKVILQLGGFILAILSRYIWVSDDLYFNEYKYV